MHMHPMLCPVLTLLTIAYSMLIYSKMIDTDKLAIDKARNG